MDLRRCPKCDRIHGTGTTCPTCSSPLVLEDETFFIGKSFGKYSIKSIVGIGGMGVVYKALHTTLEQEVALKIIIPELSDEAFTKRFQREAKILAGLKHPNIIEVFDFDISPWGVPYYVMEFLEGLSLREFIGLHPDGLSGSLMQEIVSQLVSALSFAHGRGIVHRDLKPDNVAVLTYEGRYVVKMLDFGIAKIVKGDDTTTNLTMTGAVLGTPNYMAPEQVSGEKIGPHTDQYALAIMTAEMATGRSIRGGKTLGEILTKDLQEPLILDLGDLSPAFTLAIERATEVEPEDRFPDVNAYYAALFGAGGESRAEGSPPSQLPTGAVMERTPTKRIVSGTDNPVSVSRRFPVFKVLVGLVILLGLIAAGYYLHRTGGSEEGRRERSLLSVESTIKTPMDGIKILTEKGGVMSLEGGGCFYLVDTDHPESATRMPLKEGEKILSPLADKRVALLSADALLACDVNKNKRERLVGGLPEQTLAALSPSGGILALRTRSGIVVWRLEGGKKEEILRVPLDEKVRIEAMAAGERTLFYIEAARFVVAWDLSTGKEILHLPFKERRVFAVALQEEKGLAAVGGWFDTIHLYHFNGGEPEETISSPGKTKTLFFIPDYPTLVIGKERSLSLWREGKGIIAKHEIEEGRLLNAAMVESGLVTLNNNPSRLERLTYQDFPIQKSQKVSDGELWALAAGPDGKRAYAGGADGTLYTYDLGAQAVTTHKLHTQGITSILVADGKLATASDDKTIAVWNLDNMQVLWRSKAHEYLVNNLFYNTAQKALWSSSSDGKVKKWRWPDLEEMDAFDLPNLNGAAVWLNGEETLALAGTWNSRFLVMEKMNNRWKVRENYRLGCEGVYSITAFPHLQAAVLVGIYPSRVYLYDWSARRLTPLNTMGISSGWSIPLSNNAVLLACDNGFIRIHLGRRGKVLTHSVSALFNTDLRVLAITAPLVPGKRIMAGNVYGELFIVNQGDLHFTPFEPATSRDSP